MDSSPSRPTTGEAPSKSTRHGDRDGTGRRSSFSGGLDRARRVMLNRDTPRRDTTEGGVAAPAVTRGTGVSWSPAFSDALTERLVVIVGGQEEVLWDSLGQASDGAVPTAAP